MVGVDLAGHSGAADRKHLYLPYIYGESPEGDLRVGTVGRSKRVCFVFAIVYYNDYMWPYLVIERKDISPLMPILKSLAANLADQSGEPGVSYAVYLVAGIPLIFTTAFGLKFFINGDFAAAVKL